jgi:hypothetical protein
MVWPIMPGKPWTASYLRGTGQIPQPHHRAGEICGKMQAEVQKILQPRRIEFHSLETTSLSPSEFRFALTEKAVFTKYQCENYRQ